MAEWRTCVVYDRKDVAEDALKDYEVSNTGLIKHKISGFVYKASINSSGYEFIPLKIGKSIKSFLVSRLVCMAFHGRPPTPKHEADHKDHNPLNNNEKNLQWLSRKENMTKRRAIESYDGQRGYEDLLEYLETKPDYELTEEYLMGMLLSIRRLYKMKSKKINVPLL